MHDLQKVPGLIAVIFHGKCEVKEIWCCSPIRQNGMLQSGVRAIFCAAAGCIFILLIIVGFMLKVQFNKQLRLPM